MHSSALDEKALTLRVATRRSALALAQAEWVVARLSAQAAVRCELVPISTKGDALQDHSLASIGGDGVFVKELMAALRDGRADIAVHSLKDLPTEIPADVDAGIVPLREDPRDALISRDNRYPSLEALPPRARVGTSSLRRAAQLRCARPDLMIAEMRGNVDSRVRRVLDAEYDAAVLAVAGLRRIGLLDLVGGGTALGCDTMVPAAGQGALYVQCRADDGPTHALLLALQDPASRLATALERHFLQRCGGGCVVPLGVHVECTADGAREFWACIASSDGAHALRRHWKRGSGDAAEAFAQVEASAAEMLAAGGRRIIESEKS
ncbi:MAG: hydroxymethylbilane synthase [Candidatus Eremiobacteraeota bacterium]|nr:hydroxymethylbilane synthase [Candidatus Eremiobacteraeota bacterium]